MTKLWLRGALDFFISASYHGAMQDHDDDLPDRADANLLPEQAAAVMRLWLPPGPHPGAPDSGPALSARTRRGTGPPSHGGRGRTQRYIDAEVQEWCLNLYPPLLLALLRPDALNTFTAFIPSQCVTCGVIEPDEQAWRHHACRPDAAPDGDEP